jgi:spore coat protein JB
MNNFNLNGYNFYVEGNKNKLYEPYEGFIRGNMFEDLYDPYKLNRPYEIKPMNEQTDLLTYINALDFATHDLNLYLDNFPNDEKMLHKFNEYNSELKKLTDQYERNYGPLFAGSLYGDENKWNWALLPWPWDKK